MIVCFLFLLSCYTGEAGDARLRAFLLEGSLLKCLDHQYINPLIAACLDSSPPLLIYPYCAKGNLKTLLKKSNRISENFPVSIVGYDWNSSSQVRQFYKHVGTELLLRHGLAL